MSCSSSAKLHCGWRTQRTQLLLGGPARSSRIFCGEQVLKKHSLRSCHVFLRADGHFSWFWSLWWLQFFPAAFNHPASLSSPSESWPMCLCFCHLQVDHLILKHPCLSTYLPLCVWRMITGSSKAQYKAHGLQTGVCPNCRLYHFCVTFTSWTGGLLISK